RSHGVVGVRPARHVLPRPHWVRAHGTGGSAWCDGGVQRHHARGLGILLKAEGHRDAVDEWSLSSHAGFGHEVRTQEASARRFLLSTLVDELCDGCAFIHSCVLCLVLVHDGSSARAASALCRARDGLLCLDVIEGSGATTLVARNG